jgi:hypothetical protein
MACSPSGRFAASVLLPLLAWYPAFAQSHESGLEILGEWHGTSICTKAPWNTGCNDEVTVYVFTRMAGSDSVMAHGYKRLDQAYVAMGDLALALDPARRLWQGEFSNSRVRLAVTYQIADSALSGRVVDLLNNRLIRQITARRATGARLPPD